MAIQTVKDRARLEPRREPYWLALGRGQHLGYRVTEGGGYWVARAYDAGARKRAYKALGDFASTAAADQFTSASKAAREWFAHLSRGGQPDVLTVGDAFKHYAKHQHARKGKAAGDDADARYKRHIEHDPIATIPLPKLTARHVEAWRKRLAERPATYSRRGPKSRISTPLPPERPRTAATVNRDLVALRAALNLAKRDGYATSDLAWSRALEPIEGADGRRELYLTLEQRRALVNAIDDAAARAFVQGLCLLPLRPGALAALRVRDFDARGGALTIARDKAGAGRTVPLPDSALALVRTVAKGKLPAAPLFARADGSAWTKDAWKGPIKAAVHAANLPDETTAYTCRHSTITDLTTAGLDLFSVAALAGTSVRMIERTYGHLQHDRARTALAGLAL